MKTHQLDKFSGVEARDTRKRIGNGKNGRTWEGLRRKEGQEKGQEKRGGKGTVGKGMNLLDFITWIRLRFKRLNSNVNGLSYNF